LDTEAVSERGVDVEGLAGDAVAFPLGQGIDRAHVVQPVGELDHEYPPVARHRHEELAHGGGLLCLLRPETQPVQLRDPVDDVGHLRAELPSDLVQLDLGVLHSVVQEGCAGADGVETELGHDRRHCHRMGDVGLARGPPLALMGLRRHAVGSPHDGEVLIRTVFLENCDDAVDRLGRRWDVRPGEVLDDDGPWRIARGHLQITGRQLATVLRPFVEGHLVAR
jgi:hypothetical protein